MKIMKTKNISKRIVMTALPCLMMGLGMNNSMVYADSLIPPVDSGLYYKLGGGEDVLLPAFYDTSSIPLNVGGDVGLGFDCGVFSPEISITNSLNEIKSSSLNVERQVLSDATAAVTEFPLYELSRSDPNLYNLIRGAMAGAKEDMAISTKSCEVMQSEIGAGENPYTHWGQISLGDRWRQNIGTAELSGNGDINQARRDVSQDAGKSGVPWVNPDSLTGVNSNQTVYAGGEHQPPIHIIHDTATAGYGVIVNDNTVNLTHRHLFGDTQSELSKTFPTAKAAADWIINVVGDETITTYNGGQKSSQPGVGLYSDIQYQTQQILPKLQALVLGKVSSSDLNKQLQALSPSGMALSPGVIKAIQKKPTKVIQNIITNKLAQNIAAMIVINKARLAMRILQSGGRIPAIYSNKAAQKNIQNAILLLQQDVQDILMFLKARQALMSNMLSTVIQAGQSEQQHNSAVSMPTGNVPIIKHGAVADAGKQGTDIDSNG